MCVKKGGAVVLIADYFGLANGVLLGALMEKGITLKGGQAWPHRWWPTVLDAMTREDVDLSYLLTHVAPLSAAPELYAVFDAKGSVQGRGVLKVLLRPGM